MLSKLKILIRFFFRIREANTDLLAIAHSPEGEFEHRVIALLRQLQTEHFANKFRFKEDVIDSFSLVQFETHFFSECIRIDGINFERFSRNIQDECGKSAEYLLKYNGMYSHPKIKDLMRAIWGDAFNENSDDIGHILPRNRSSIFRSIFPELDVDNLLNLAPQYFSHNRLCTDFVLPMQFALYRCYLEVHSRICRNQHKIDEILKGSACKHYPRRPTSADCHQKLIELEDLDGINTK